MSPRARSSLRALAATALALLLAACASPDFERPGASRAEVVARLGAPAGISPLAGGGERLLYTTQPAGYQAFHLDFDAGGRLVRKEQVLTFAKLSAVVPGQWTLADVQRTFGRPMLVERVARFDGDIWTYRFLDDFSTRRQAHIHIDRSGVVRLVMFTDEPVPSDDRMP
ncbi:hypothetical protein B2J86_13585 [Acidovorax sp. SRB_14]|uniref:hypothetical protein n=1 Tax=Acidovorax sp. SRB_14 TaxID=1962699 RepID=UPI001565F47E|nr:hypothetical protein [Acidovorax sp. SRB_14]NMM81943.1 hypothetical protein [Acidovorax sp. SRB_14]